jgi:hypothetical protein
MPAFLHVLDLPPPFRLLALREAGDAFGYATGHARELGAGSLVFVGRFDLAEFAVVLEPEEPLARARGIFYAGMGALADALSTLAPPETSIAIEWPDALDVDRGLVGGGRLAWPEGTDECAVPDWLVFGAMVRLVWVRAEGATQPEVTALADAGFGIVDAKRLAEDFARHLMVAVDRWQDGDFATIAQAYEARLRPARDVRRTVDTGGNLRIERQGKPAECLELGAALAAPSWLDPDNREPRPRIGAAVVS